MPPLRRLVCPLVFLAAMSTACSDDGSSDELEEFDENLWSSSDDAGDTAIGEDANAFGFECPQGVTGYPEVLGPVPGEVFYVQIGLSGFALGESALVVAPDGSIFLVDAGNDSHADTVLDVLEELHEKMDGAGFDSRPARSIDHVVLTHMHADHVDGLENLLGEAAVTNKIIHRGLFDLSDGVDGSTYEQLCEVLGDHDDREFPLCHGTPASCDSHDGEPAYPADDCDGLFAGNLLVDGDQGRAHLEFSDRSRLEFVAANGVIGSDNFWELVGSEADDHNHENARSLVGILSNGPFRLIFAGDLTSGDRGDDDMEGFYAARLTDASDLDDRGVDVVQSNHHGRRTSNSMTWMDRVAPVDGRSRNVVMGISAAHVRSPHQEVLDNILHDERLADGKIWTTKVATLGATAPQLVDADGGRIVVATIDGGQGYVVQALDDDGQLLDSRADPSVGCGTTSLVGVE